MLILFFYYCFIASGCVFGIELNKNETKESSPIRVDPVIESKNFGAIDLDNLLDVWNPIKMVHLWTSTNRQKLNKISLSCAEDISRYLNGISMGFHWALRMSDSSGRYNSGFFTGNKYWIGAFDQCRQIKNEFTINYNANKENITLAQMNNHLPFDVAVSSANLEIQLFKTDPINHTHKVTFGLCLPATCHIHDITNLLEFYITNNHDDDRNRNIIVNYVRNLSEGYSLWDDSTLYIILGFTAIILLFTIVGTCYDIALRYKYLDKLNAKSNNSNVTNIAMHNKIAAGNEEDCIKSIRHSEITAISKLWAMTEHNGSFDVHDAKAAPKPMSEALLSFSLLLNLSKLVNLNVGQDTLAPIHGFRFISMLWIIMVHTCLLTNEISDTNLFRLEAETNFLYQTISNGNYAVDTFFFISGCLVAFLYFQTMSKRKLSERNFTKGFKGKVNQFFGMMVYRYIRLTPPYLLVIGIIQISTKWHHDHTMIELSSFDYQTCEKYWWRNALYINTYFDMDDRCMVWSWYLANDTQFYTFGIVILIISGSYFTVGASIGIIVLIGSWITTTIIILKSEHTPSIEDPFAHYESLYDKPWIRIGPYLIGMTTGWYLHNIDCKLRINKTISIVGWSFSIATLLSIVYGLYGRTFGPIASAMYTTLSHSGWAMSIAWILIVCVTNNGGFIAKILSWKYIFPLSRLTYCAYLIHPVLTRTIILRGESMLHLSQELIAMLFLGITITSYVVSLFLSLLYEAPMVSLLRIIHPVRQWRYKNNSQIHK